MLVKGGTDPYDFKQNILYDGESVNPEMGELFFNILRFEQN